MRIFKMECDEEGRTYINVYDVVERGRTKSYTLIDSIPADEEDDDEEEDADGRWIFWNS